MTTPALLRGRPPVRVPAFDLEQIIIDRVDAWLMDVEGLSKGLSLADPSERLKRARECRAVLCGADKLASFNIFRKLVRNVHLGNDDVAIEVQLISDEPSELTEKLTSTVAKVRVGKETKLVVGVGNTAPARHDPKLINTVVKAYRARKLLEAGQTIPEIGVALRVSKIQAARLVRMSYFAPQITTAILDGQQPLGLATSMLTLPANMPLDWKHQCQLLNCT